MGRGRRGRRGVLGLRGVQQATARLGAGGSQFTFGQQATLGQIVDLAQLAAIDRQGRVDVSTARGSGGALQDKARGEGRQEHGCDRE